MARERSDVVAPWQQECKDISAVITMLRILGHIQDNYFTASDSYGYKKSL